MISKRQREREREREKRKRRQRSDGKKEGMKEKRWIESEGNLGHRGIRSRMELRTPVVLRRERDLR